jgi:hypothetical protein
MHTDWEPENREGAKDAKHRKDFWVHAPRRLATRRRQSLTNKQTFAMLSVLSAFAVSPSL